MPERKYRKCLSCKHQDSEEERIEFFTINEDDLLGICDDCAIQCVNSLEWGLRYPTFIALDKEDV